LKAVAATNSAAFAFSEQAWLLLHTLNALLFELV
jgi:hypothetical protein